MGRKGVGMKNFVVFALGFTGMLSLFMGILLVFMGNQFALRAITLVSYGTVTSISAYIINKM